MPVLNFIFRTGKAIPINSQQKSPEVYRQAFESMAQALNEGELICLFPEGKLTTDGEIDVFKPGIEKILKLNPVPVVPLALRGLWGSFFSHKEGMALTRPFRRFWSKVEIVAGPPMSPESASAETLRQVVGQLRGESR
jgi:1-acyl-sn-glycerol-3-phosphate acyltransferase